MTNSSAMCSSYVLTPDTSCIHGQCMDGVCVPSPGWTCVGDMIDSKGGLCEYNQDIIQIMWIAVLLINIGSVFLTVYSLVAHVKNEHLDHIASVKILLKRNVIRAQLYALASNVMFIIVSTWKQTASPPAIGVDIGVSIVFAIAVMCFWAGANTFLWSANCTYILNLSVTKTYMYMLFV
jgi:hypothetical protein